MELVYILNDNGAIKRRKWLVREPFATKLNNQSRTFLRKNGIVKKCPHIIKCGCLNGRDQLLAAGLSFGLPTRIGQDGTLTSQVDWQKPNDGLVVPLRLGVNARDPLTGRYLLEHYSPKPAGTKVVNPNPNLQMRSWSGLDGWNIRSTADNGTAVVFKQIDFSDPLLGRMADIQLQVSESQPCS